MNLRIIGKPSPFEITIYFKWKNRLGSVKVYVPTRKDLAKWLKTFRIARTWIKENLYKTGWNGIPTPCSVKRQRLPQFCFRWFAQRNCVLLIYCGDRLHQLVTTHYYRTPYGTYRHKRSLFGWLNITF